MVSFPSLLQRVRTSINVYHRKSVPSFWRRAAGRDDTDAKDAYDIEIKIDKEVAVAAGVSGQGPRRATGH